ncbi:MAG: phage terminase large subunit [Paracoccaceae bacterium]
MSELSNHEYLRAVLRNDFPSFVARVFATVSPGDIYQNNWHVHAITHQLERVQTGDCSRLIITMPPRCLKSIAGSVAFPAWLLGHDPSIRVLAVSYAEGLAEKLALDCVKVIESAWYRECFPATRIAKGRSARADFETTRGGGRFSTSIGGTLTGRGGDIIIIDDPHKPDEATSDAKRNKVIDWYRTTLLSRLNAPSTDPIVLIQQRVHEGDLAGELIEQGGWEHLNLPAIAELDAAYDLGRRGTKRVHQGDLLHTSRLPKALLDQRKEELGSYVFAAQYQQRPSPIEGGLVKWHWFQTYDTPPNVYEGGQMVQSWDTAIRAEQNSDYSVCTTWLVRQKRAWLLDVIRLKLEFPELQKSIVSEAKKWKATRVLIEQAGSGHQLLQHFSRTGYPRVWGIQPKNDKATRLMSVTPAIESGRVTIPQDAPWLESFRRELLLFPNGRHDDQVDSLSQFLLWLEQTYHGPLVGHY